MSSGGGGAGGAVREVTLVVRVQGPSGIGGSAGIGGGMSGAGRGFGGGAGRGIPGGGTPAATGIPTAAGPMPAFGSTPGDQTQGYGIPGGARGGAYFQPNTGTFEQRGTPRAPARRRPEPSPTFTEVSSIRGGGGSLGIFRSRGGAQGSSLRSVRQLKKATDDLANSLGNATIEMVRLLTWSRPITMGTHMMREAQANYGIPLVKGAGLAGLGMVGAAGALWTADKFMNAGGGLDALRQPAGRAGFMDRFTQHFDLTRTPGYIGAREMAVVAQENAAQAARRQEQESRLGRVRATSAAVAQTDFQARYAATSYKSNAMFATGQISFDEYWSGVRGNLDSINSSRRDLQRRIATAESRLGGGSGGIFSPAIGGTAGMAEAMQSVQYGVPHGTTMRQAFGQLWQGIFTSADTRGNRRMRAGMTRAQSRFEMQQVPLEAMRAQEAELLNQDVRYRQSLNSVYQGYISNQQSQFQQGINQQEAAVRGAQENLSRVQGMQANLTFTLAGYSPFEVKAAIKRYKQIEAGQVPVPRADQLSGALGAMILQGSPEKLQEFEKRYRNQAGIGEAIRLTGFTAATSAAQQAADQMDKELADWIQKEGERLKELRKSFAEFIDETARLVSEAAKNKAEQAAQADAQAQDAAKSPIG